MARTRLVTTAAGVVGRPPSADGELVRAYTDRTPGSAASFGVAGRVLPGGETRAVTSYPPYPVVITQGHGARLADVDGHSYLDLVNNYTAMVHGSAFAPVTEAVAELLPNGFAFASPHPYQVALAEPLVARVPSVQRVRFTNSGTEAALLAARIAARATGRRRLLLFDGAYHGSASLFLPGSPDVVRAPWNDLAAVTKLLGPADHGIAAVSADLADRILAGAAAAGVPAEVTRAGSIMNVHLDSPSQLADLHLALLLSGVYTTPRGMINLSTALSPGDLDDIAAAYATAFTRLRTA
jgi:glutamate-1-semialdehyde aminotransferase